MKKCTLSTTSCKIHNTTHHHSATRKHRNLTTHDRVAHNFTTPLTHAKGHKRGRQCGGGAAVAIISFHDPENPSKDKRKRERDTSTTGVTNGALCFMWWLTTIGRLPHGLTGLQCVILPRAQDTGCISIVKGRTVWWGELQANFLPKSVQK